MHSYSALSCWTPAIAFSSCIVGDHPIGWLAVYVCFGSDLSALAAYMTQMGVNFRELSHSSQCSPRNCFGTILISGEKILRHVAIKGHWRKPAILFQMKVWHSRGYLTVYLVPKGAWIAEQSLIKQRLSLPYLPRCDSMTQKTGYFLRHNKPDASQAVVMYSGVGATEWNASAYKTISSV